MKYLSLTTVSFKTMLAYRVQFFAGLVGSLAWLAVLWFLWTAVFGSSPNSAIGGLTLSAMIAYSTVSIAIRGIIETDNEGRMENMVKTGAIVTVLARPVYYPFWVLFSEIGRSGYSLITRSLPVVLIAALVLGIAPPANFPAFIVSVAMSWLISWSLVYLTGMWAFWTTGSVWGIRRARRIIEEFFSGAIIPISFFPAWLAGIAFLLPFQAMFNIPLSIYTGLISGSAIVSALCLQLAWALVMGLTCWAVWRRAEKKMVVQGG